MKVRTDDKRVDPKHHGQLEAISQQVLKDKVTEGKLLKLRQNVAKLYLILKKDGVPKLMLREITSEKTQL